MTGLWGQYTIYYLDCGVHSWNEMALLAFINVLCIHAFFHLNHKPPWPHRGQGWTADNGVHIATSCPLLLTVHAAWAGWTLRHSELKAWLVGAHSQEFLQHFLKMTCPLNKLYTYSLYFSSCILIILIWLSIIILTWLLVLLLYWYDYTCHTT